MGPGSSAAPSRAALRDVWHADHAEVAPLPFAEAAAHGEMVINATAESLAGKVLVDIANPLDFSGGFPPTLLVKDTDSLGEQIQRAFPDARVVKTLNTLTAALMVDPRALADGDHSILLSGNDTAAKASVTELLQASAGRTSSTSATSAPHVVPRCYCRSGCG